MTRMSGHRQKKVVDNTKKPNGKATGGPGAFRSQEEILRGLFPPGAVIDLEKLEYSFAASYNGPPVAHPLPKAPLAFLADGNAKNLSNLLPVAQPLRTFAALPSSSSSLSPELTSDEFRQQFPFPAAALEAAEELFPSHQHHHLHHDASPNVRSTSEIEEVGMNSPTSPRYPHRRTPSSEGVVTDSSVLQYSEEVSPLQSEQFPGMGTGSGRYLEPSPSGKQGFDDGGGTPRRKGQCHGCLRGRWFTERETCLVCGSKFCRDCVLLVMGSMPEGRKCQRCVGRPILESQRSSLGRPSRLLRKLLSPLEVQQCMKSEKECSANQLQPEQVRVNEKPLSPEELVKLLPHVRLKPGDYWYDKASGLWGKEGEKPTAVIAPDMNVGGNLQPHASKGSTQVFLNGREVTKLELKFFKALGVPCTPQTYLVLYADGRYGDEGQKDLKGNLWNMPAMRFLHMFFSFPTPRGGHPESPASTSRRVSPAASLEIKPASKILLLGHDGSGRSTIFKQTKIIHDTKFWPLESDKYRILILAKCYQFLGILLEARERFEEEYWTTHETEDISSSKNIYSLDEQLKAMADEFLDDLASGNIQKLGQTNLSKLWNDPAIQETHKRKDELHMLPEVSFELLSRVLQTNEYVPQKPDILLAEGLEQGTGLADVEFTLDDKDSSDSHSQESSCRRYQLISIGGLASNEFRKWLGMFEEIKILVYSVAISDYDQSYTDSTGEVHNKLIFSRDLFYKIVGYPCFRDTPLVLLLNKYDKFEEKVTKGIRLTSCEWFSDYSPVGSSNASQVQQAYMYVVHKYKRLLEGRRVYTLQLNAQDQNSVTGALEYVQQILKCEEEKRAGLWIYQEESMYGDTSSFGLMQ